MTTQEQESTPVSIVGTPTVQVEGQPPGVPLDVKIVGGNIGDRRMPKVPPTIILPDGKVVAAPLTTEEEDRVAQGQRHINLIWEQTQMRVALSVTWSALFVSAVLAVGGKVLGTPDLQLAAIVFLFGVANLVTGFYFGRTNHTKTGGVGQTR